MAEEKGEKGVREILRSAESNSDASQLSGKSLLTKSLDEALQSLKINFNYDNPFNPAGSDSADYDKMFAAIAENFSQLSKELSSMRSTYLPYELVDNLTQEALTGGAPQKIAQVVGSEILMESYENTFFRLLGMPSTADIEDQALVTVGIDGKYYGPESDLGFALTSKVLEKRAVSIRDRADSPSTSSYDFITGAVPSFQRLSNLNFTKIKELDQILRLISELLKVDIRDANTSRAAESLYSLISNNKSSDHITVKTEDLELRQMVAHFTPSEGQDDAASQSDLILDRTLDIALMWLEPRLFNSITKNLKIHIWNEHVLKVPNSTLLNLNEPSNFWRYSYLLFPPVQDGRIARCINEASKIVAEPFLPESLRRVNGKKLRSTLLEAVIRIRLDAVSGFPKSVARVTKSGAAQAGEEDTRPITPDELGILESLLIVRLFSALHGFAKDARSKIKAAQKIQQKTGISPGQTEPENDGGKVTTTEKELTAEEKKLQSIILVEESLLLLFGDGSVPEALSFQEGVSRNAGVKDAHFMSSAISILDVPKRWAEGQAGKAKEDKQREVDKGGGKSQANLRNKLGMAKGVGALDILVYLIALFTANEETLIGLLNERQFAYLKAEYPEGYFDNFRRKEITIGKAVSEIADRAFDAYQLFRYMLPAERTTFRRPRS